MNDNLSAELEANFVAATVAELAQKIQESGYDSDRVREAIIGGLLKADFQTAAAQSPAAPDELVIEEALNLKTIPLEMEKYSTGPRSDKETPVAFVERVYADYIDVLTFEDLLARDVYLYGKLRNELFTKARQVSRPYPSLEDGASVQAAIAWFKEPKQPAPVAMTTRVIPDATNDGRGPLGRVAL